MDYNLERIKNAKNRKKAIFVQSALNGFLFGFFFGQFNAIRELFSLNLTRAQTFKHVAKVNFTYGAAFSGIGIFIKYIDLQNEKL